MDRQSNQPSAPTDQFTSGSEGEPGGDVAIRFRVSCLVISPTGTVITERELEQSYAPGKRDAWR